MAHSEALTLDVDDNRVGATRIERLPVLVVECFNQLVDHSLVLLLDSAHLVPFGD
jgi:hypothetical protein